MPVTRLIQPARRLALTITRWIGPVASVTVSAMATVVAVAE